MNRIFENQTHKMSVAPAIEGGTIVLENKSTGENVTLANLQAVDREALIDVIFNRA